MGAVSLDTPAQLPQQRETLNSQQREKLKSQQRENLNSQQRENLNSQEREKWVQKPFQFSSLSSSLPLHSPFSLDLLQKDVALTGTVLDSGELLARAGDQISSSSSQLVAGRGHTLCLGSVTWCLTRCAT